MKKLSFVLLFISASLLPVAEGFCSTAAGENSFNEYRGGTSFGNRLTRCEHVVGVANSVCADQIVLWFEQPLSYELVRIDATSFLLSFHNVNSDDFLATNVIDKLAALQGVVDVKSDFQEDTHECSFVVVYNPEAISFKFNCPPSASYLKIDGFLLDQGAKADLAGSFPRRVVIDPGHGGDDFGAVGLYGIKEKDITLDMAGRLYNLLKKSGYDVHLIRNEDVFVSIEEKIERLHALQGAVFICMHANAYSDPQIQRIELYPRVSDFHATDRYLARDEKKARLFFEKRGRYQTRQSNYLAEIVRKSLVNALDAHPPVLDGKLVVSNVKICDQRPFRTLLLSGVPALLVEAGYITNMIEARLLMTTEYRDLIVNAIKNSLDTYFLEKIQ